MNKYYCFDCGRQCSTISMSDHEMVEFWGQQQWHHSAYLICEQCGSQDLEEIRQPEAAEEILDDDVEDNKLIDTI